MGAATADMFTTIIIGNSQTRQIGRAMVTPRGYDMTEAGPAAKPSLARRANEILCESFRIIDTEIGAHSFDLREWQVVRRIIHASGDVEMARLVQFNPGAVTAGIEALRGRTPIITDVRMVAAGINAALCESLGLEVRCFLNNAAVDEDAAAQGRTRCAAAMERAIAAFPKAVYVVGNAPTALAALTAAVRRGQARPRLVVAMPVGFVGVLESKEEALSLPAPVIAVGGRRGGSAVAAAAINALLVLASEDHQ
jgi:precorrin-8X/cobalt-precorrin-8 methylmutase